MKSPLASVDWQRAAISTLRLSRHGTCWMLIHGGRLLQISGVLLCTVGTALSPARPDPRRK